MLDLAERLLVCTVEQPRNRAVVRGGAGSSGGERNQSDAFLRLMLQRSGHVESNGTTPMWCVCVCVATEPALDAPDAMIDL